MPRSLQETSAAFARELEAEAERMRSLLPDAEIASVLLAVAIHIARGALPNDHVAIWLKGAIDSLNRDAATEH